MTSLLARALLSAAHALGLAAFAAVEKMKVVATFTVPADAAQNV